MAYLLDQSYPRREPSFNITNICIPFLSAANQVNYFCQPSFSIPVKPSYDVVNIFMAIIHSCNMLCHLDYFSILTVV